MNVTIFAFGNEPAHRPLARKANLLVLATTPDDRQRELKPEKCGQCGVCQVEYEVGAPRSPAPERRSLLSAATTRPQLARRRIPNYII
jgi:hypothetical protein